MPLKMPGRPSPAEGNALPRYALAILAAAVALILRYLLTPYLGEGNLYHTIWVAVVFAAWYCGLGPSIVTAAIGMLGVNYWIIPRHSLLLLDRSQLYGMVSFTLFSGLIVALGEANRRAAAKRDLADREARRARNLFETFMDNSPAATYLKDEDGRYVYTNSINQNRFNVRAVGKTDFELFRPEVAAQHREQDRLVLRENKAREFIESAIGPGGERTWLCIKFPVVGEDGKKFVGGKSFDITDRKRAEDALRQARQELEDRVRERTAELRTANDNLRELSARLLQLQDEERRRIARELHDSVGQLLAAISMNTATVQAESQQLSSAAARCVSENAAMVQQISSEIRTISHLLHPPLLDEAGLVSALRWYVDGFSERSKIQVELEMPANFGRFSREMEISIFRIVQECLTNIHRHSGSQTAAVRIAEDNGQIRVEIEDAGKGMPLEKQQALSSSGPTGVGVRGMRERLRQLGGDLEIESNGSGTVVIANLPLLYANAATASEEVA